MKIMIAIVLGLFLFSAIAEEVDAACSRGRVRILHRRR